MKPPVNAGPTGGDLAGLGIYLAVVVLIPLLGGVALDSAWHTAPLFVLVGLGIGLAAGAAGVWLKVREFTK